MFKKVLLAGALLAPVLAYGASPSTDLSVQIVPAASTTPPPSSPTPPPSSNGIACDIGPNYTGTIPAGAQAAGFTHCAANYDFSQPFYATQSNWLNCAGASNPQFYILNDGLGNGNCPSASNLAAEFSIVSDGGSSVLQLAYRQADWNSGIADTKMGTQSNVGWPNPAGTAFPNAVYTEVTQRITAATQNSSCPSNQPTCIITGYWTFPADESQDPFNEIMSFVFIEMYGDPPENGGGSGNEGQGCCYSNPTEPGSVSGYDPTVYHDYGSRVTVASDGSGNYGYCFYLDQKQLGCSALGGMPNPSTWLNGRNSYILEVGPQATSTTSCNGTCEPQQTQVYLVQSVRIWTCSNWQSSQCNSSVDTGSP